MSAISRRGLHDIQATIGTKIVPLVTDRDPSYFVSEDLVPTQKVNVEGVLLDTRPLVMGKSFSLLGIGHSSELSEQGLIDVTDVVEPNVALACVYLNFPAIGRVVRINLSDTPTSSAYLEIKSHQRLLQLQLRATVGVSLARESDYEDLQSYALGGVADAQDSFWRSFLLSMSLSVDGSIEPEIGDTFVNAAPLVLECAQCLTKSGYVPDSRVLSGLMEGAHVAGYELAATRANNNRRRR